MARFQARGGRWAGVSNRGQDAVATGPGPGRAHILSLEAEAILLQVGRDVLPGQPLDVHEVEDGRGHRLVHPELVHRIDKTLVELSGTGRGARRGVRRAAHSASEPVERRAAAEGLGSGARAGCRGS